LVNATTEGVVADLLVRDHRRLAASITATTEWSCQINTDDFAHTAANPLSLESILVLKSLEQWRFAAEMCGVLVQAYYQTLA